jgi:hypothetical protein
MTLWSEKLSLLGLIVIVLEVALVALVVSPESARNARIAEQQTAIEVFGVGLAERARDFAERHFTEDFVESGFFETLEGMLVPRAEARQRAVGLETFGTEVFEWSKQRIRTLAATVFGVYHRVYLMGLMAAFAVTLIIACMADALVQRKAALLNAEITNAVFYHGAKRTLIWLLLLPLLITISPVTIGSTVLVLWGVSLPALLWVGARHVQEM